MPEKQWISVVMIRQMKEDLDAYIEMNGYNRSEFIRGLIREKIYKDGER